MNNRSNFKVIAQTPNIVILFDVGPWDQFKTITNNVEEVVRTCQRFFALGARRLFYVDSAGDLTEIRHTAGQFTGFGHI